MDCVVGLGSNLGDREATLVGGGRAVAELGVLLGASAVYESEPVGPPQPRYLNAAVRIETPLAPVALLERLLEVERRFGRTRTLRWGPRTLDLDILFIFGVHLESPALTVPHPQLLERPFAIVPLLEVAPGAAHPVTRVALAELSRFSDFSGLRRVADQLLVP